MAHHLSHIANLERHIGALRSDLDAARQDRDQERTERYGEREKVDRITAELAELSKRFVSSTDDARSRELSLQTALEAARIERGSEHDRALKLGERLTAMQAEMAATQAIVADLRQRTWWQRLMVRGW